VRITGTTTIESLGTGASRVRFVRFTGALTLTHDAAALILPGGADITTAAGDCMLVVSDASSNVRVHFYWPGSFITATAAQVLARTAGKIITAANMWGPLVPVALAIATGDVAIDIATGRKFTLSFDESFELQLPTNCVLGDEFVIHFTEDASGAATPSFAAGFVGNSDALPTINAGALERTRLHFEVTEVSGSTATEVIATYAGGLFGDGS
jgi:hypothetical protein